MPKRLGELLESSHQRFECHDSHIDPDQHPDRDPVKCFAAWYLIVLYDWCGSPPLLRRLHWRWVLWQLSHSTSTVSFHFLIWAQRQNARHWTRMTLNQNWNRLWVARFDLGEKFARQKFITQNYLLLIIHQLWIHNLLAITEKSWIISSMPCDTCDQFCWQSTTDWPRLKSCTI